MLTDILLIICIALLIVLIIINIVKKDRSNNDRIVELSQQMDNLVAKNYEQQIKLMEILNSNSAMQTNAISAAISNMLESNEKKLDEMRMIVDEKLTSTLNKRLDSSFEQVSNQLGTVYKALGEMKEISNGVTGLNKILTNVKNRGTWAELQLQNILDQTIPNMYTTNVRTNPNYNGRVEFAVKIPNSENNEFVWLPIDSKFPMEDYSRIISAGECGDIQAVENARKSLETRIREEAKAIKNYVSEPYTTPFAIMYLATEGLYAEVMSNKNGLPERLQDMNILVAGPGTIIALLNCLQLGFSTIAINKRANEVWNILGNAKNQYEQFALLLEKARRKIEEAGKTIDDAEHRNDIIRKKLKDVESLAD